MSHIVQSLMIEVFKTNIVDKEKAALLIAEIQKKFVNCSATIDLEDCDRVLVVRSTEEIDPQKIITVAGNVGCKAEVLPDF